MLGSLVVAPPYGETFCWSLSLCKMPEDKGTGLPPNPLGGFLQTVLS